MDFSNPPAHGIGTQSDSLDLTFDFESFCDPDATDNVDMPHGGSVMFGGGHMYDGANQRAPQRRDDLLVNDMARRGHAPSTSAELTALKAPRFGSSTITETAGQCVARPPQLAAKRRKVTNAIEADVSRRPHSVVEQRYRASLNEKYASLADTIHRDSTQRICRLSSVELEQLKHFQDSREGSDRQNKTATLSVAITTIRALDVCVSLKAKELEILRRGVEDVKDRIRKVLAVSTPPQPPTPNSLDAAQS